MKRQIFEIEGGCDLVDEANEKDRGGQFKTQNRRFLERRNFALGGNK